MTYEHQKKIQERVLCIKNNTAATAISLWPLHSILPNEGHMALIVLCRVRGN